MLRNYQTHQNEGQSTKYAISNVTYCHSQEKHRDSEKLSYLEETQETQSLLLGVGS
jgi:hypothetical protein